MAVTVDDQALSVADCCRRCGLSEKTVRAWLSAPEGAPDFLPSTLASKPGLRSGRSAYLIQPEDLEQHLARITVPGPLPLDAIRPGEAAEIFAGRSSLNRRDRERHTEAVRAEVKRGRLKAYVLAGAVRYSRTEVEEVARTRDEEGYRFEASPHHRAGKAERVRGQRDGLVTVEDAARACGRAVSTVRVWATEGRHGSVKRGGRWFLDEAKLPPPKARARALPQVIVSCAVCRDPLKRYASEVRKTEQRAKDAGRPVLFFCSTCFNTEKARTLLGHPARKSRPPRSAEARARQGAAERAAWTPERRVQQRERGAQINKDATATDEARRIVEGVRTRHGSDLTVEDELRRISARRQLNGVQNRKRDRAAADRAQQAIALREAGRTDEEICEQLGIADPRTLRRYYVKAKLPPRKRGPRVSDTTP